MNGYMIAGIANGLSNGIKLGTQIRGAMDQAQVRNVMSEGLEGAKQSHAADIEANSQVGSKANEADTMTMPTYDDTRGNSYANAEDQAKAAKKNAPLPEDFYLRDVVPKIKETYIAQGNMQGAEAWDQWAQEKSTQQGMKHWTNALRAGQMGDFKGYADHMVKAYNTPNYFDDGLHAEGYDLVKDKDGNTTGLTLKMKNKETGEVYAQTIHGQDDMVQAGIGLLDPANAFKTTLAQVQARQAAQAKADLEGAKSTNRMTEKSYAVQAEHGSKVALQTQKDNTAMERAEVLATGKVQQQTQKDDSAMKRLERGKELEAANKKSELMLKHEAGVLFKKGASPQEAHRMLVQGMNAKYVDYQGRPTMTPAELSARATEMVEATYGKGALSGGQSNPLSGGMTTTQAPAPAAPAKTNGAVRLDMKTGQVVPY